MRVSLRRDALPRHGSAQGDANAKTKRRPKILTFRPSDFPVKKSGSAQRRYDFGP
jgi:hypothetical protein